MELRNVITGDAQGLDRDFHAAPVVGESTEHADAEKRATVQRDLRAMRDHLAALRSMMHTSNARLDAAINDIDGAIAEVNIRGSSAVINLAQIVADAEQSATDAISTGGGEERQQNAVVAENQQVMLTAAEYAHAYSRLSIAERHCVDVLSAPLTDQNLHQYMAAYVYRADNSPIMNRVEAEAMAHWAQEDPVGKAAFEELKHTDPVIRREVAIQDISLRDILTRAMQRMKPGSSELQKLQTIIGENLDKSPAAAELWAKEQHHQISESQLVAGVIATLKVEHKRFETFAASHGDSVIALKPEQLADAKSLGDTRAQIARYEEILHDPRRLAHVKDAVDDFYDDSKKWRDYPEGMRRDMAAFIKGQALANPYGFLQDLTKDRMREIQKGLVNPTPQDLQDLKILANKNANPEEASQALIRFATHGHQNQMAIYLSAEAKQKLQEGATQLVHEGAKHDNGIEGLLGFPAQLQQKETTAALRMAQGAWGIATGDHIASDAGALAVGRGVKNALVEWHVNKDKAESIGHTVTETLRGNGRNLIATEKVAINTVNGWIASSQQAWDNFWQAKPAHTQQPAHSVVPPTAGVIGNSAAATHDLEAKGYNHIVNGHGHNLFAGANGHLDLEKVRSEFAKFRTQLHAHHMDKDVSQMSEAELANAMRVVRDLEHAHVEQPASAPKATPAQPHPAAKPAHGPHH